MRFLRQSLTGLILASITLAFLALAVHMVWSAVSERMASEPRAEPRRERVFAVHVVEAEARAQDPVLIAFGQVQSRRTLEIRAQVAGTLIALSEEFVEGGEVETGQFLARIDPADAEAALARAESDLADAEADRRDAERSLVLARDEEAAAREQAELRQTALTRQQDLKSRRVGTAAAVETAALAAAQARQAVLGARQAVATAEGRMDQTANALTRAKLARDEAARRLAETEIRAEFAGRLSGVDVVEGGIVSTNERLADLIDADALEVAFRVSTPQFSRLLDAQSRLIDAPVRVTLDAYGANITAEGQLIRAGAAVAAGETGRLVFARLDAGQGLKPGDFVTVAINEPPLANAIRLPATALGSDETVLVLGDEDRLEAVAVTLLRRQGDEVIVAADQLSGRRVVAERSPLLGEGIKVRPLGDAGGAEPVEVPLTDARRARLIAFVQSATNLPSSERDRLLRELERDQVPAGLIQRLETRFGG
ncbi:efflux RND transporter periplasmic adaptor subunit [Roseovarius sp. C7]|uniref:efflux RND transporter periplasmic adaptor subunit n=1 Tax=Roseovarius sp. C7 TaxID=3398643 RepID=UPI0039F713BA